MQLLRRRPTSFDIQVQDLVLRITAPDDFAEESRAAALSFWEQLQSYGAARSGVPELEAAAGEDGERRADDRQGGDRRRVRGRGRPDVLLPGRGRRPGRTVPRRSISEVTVACDGDYFLQAKKRLKLAVKRRGGEPITVALEPASKGIGVSTTLGRGEAGHGPDGLAVIAQTCMLADAAAAGVQACLPKHDGFGMALHYLQRVPGVDGGVVVVGERIGVAGGWRSRR